MKKLFSILAPNVLQSAVKLVDENWGQASLHAPSPFLPSDMLLLLAITLSMHSSSSAAFPRLHSPSSYSIILRQRSENHKKHPAAPKNNTSRRAFIFPPNRSAHLASIKPAPIPAMVAKKPIQLACF